MSLSYARQPGPTCSCLTTTTIALSYARQPGQPRGLPLLPDILIFLPYPLIFSHLHRGGSGGSRRFWVAGHSRTFPDIPGHSRTFPDIPGHSRTFPDIPGHSRTFPDIPGHSRTFPDLIPGHSRTFPDIPGHSRTFPDIPGDIPGHVRSPQNLFLLPSPIWPRGRSRITLAEYGVQVHGTLGTPE